MRQSYIAMFVAAVALSAGCNSDHKTIVPAQIADDMVADSLQEAWQERRLDAMAAREAQTQVLATARASLAGQRLGIQRDVAVCFEARRAMDAGLREAMVPGRDFAADIDTWRRQAQGVEDFCAYALTVGLPERPAKKRG